MKSLAHNNSQGNDNLVFIINEQIFSMIVKSTTIFTFYHISLIFDNRGSKRNADTLRIPEIKKITVVYFRLTT